MPQLSGKKKKESVVEMVLYYFDEEKRWENATDTHEVLVNIVAAVRPQKLKNLAPVDISDLICLLADNEHIKKEFS
ncbi:MAG: hypothetical protein KDC50_03825, partial [Flavobacterium sp.]|nr:hypothetical protein [Flavobacterium sp.]